MPRDPESQLPANETRTLSSVLKPQALRLFIALIAAEGLSVFAVVFFKPFATDATGKLNGTILAGELAAVAGIFVPLLVIVLLKGRKTGASPPDEPRGPVGPMRRF